ncbi:hypothetical protein RSOLAG22IIIB_09181 [Rhizoctonia solani]|uniref:Uncharacterized protein n=1 Tax=Rhizoctonia solani TaxID=456999 RepID=A0A0K6FXQ6_9AGAM|nr:hypothetical protein RSOLAG22IIIB_09181 [Rhizoctonia solani]
MPVWSNLTRVFDFGGQWGSATIRLVEGDDASFTLRRVESMLEDSMKVLQSHEQILSSRQFSTFTIKHRRLLLKVVELKMEMESQGSRDALVDPSAYNSDVVQLHGQTEIFQRDVITASRRAQLDEEGRLFAAGQEPGSPDTTWYSIITPQESSSDLDTASNSSTLVDREPLVAVAHVRERNSSIAGPNSPENEAYRRILIMESNEKRMVMIDPNPCYLKKDADPMNESTLLEMSRAGETFLRATHPDNLKDYEVVGKSEEPCWVDSLIDTMARLGAGVSTTTV